MSRQVGQASPSVTNVEEAELPQGLQEELMPVPAAQHKVDRPKASVTLTYSGLSRKSKEFLDRILLEWAKWHASTYQSTGNRIGSEAGTYEYNPTAISAENIIVLIDKPDAQTEKSQDLTGFNIQYESENQVPRYDRGSTAVLQPVRFDKEGEPIAASSSGRPERRCHNCGSYAHVVQACPRGKDHNEIRQRAQERGVGGGRSRQSTVRYYADSAAIAAGQHAGSVDYLGLQPGQLSDETREALGLGPLDPPPWLDKMRQLGYPPMYKHNKRKDDLFIFDDQTGKPTAALEAAAASVSQGEEKARDGQEMVAFPGVNAPALQGADARLWGHPLAPLPSEAGSKRNQPEYPTQEDVAAAPPLKRIKPNETGPQPFTFSFQHPGQSSAQEPSSAAARDQPFVFTSGAHASGRQARQNSGQTPHGGDMHSGALPPNLTPRGQASTEHAPFMGFGQSFGNQDNSSGHFQGSMYPGFGLPAHLSGHVGAASHMAPNAAAAFGHPFELRPNALPAYPYGMQTTAQHMGFPGMNASMQSAVHPAYGAFAAQAMPTQFPFSPQAPDPYQYTPSENPPPPPPFPPA